MTVLASVQHIPVNGIEIAYYSWLQTILLDSPPPTTFFAHATGFHARCWDQVVGHLPLRRCYAIDSRGHGQSSKPPPSEPYAWRNFGEDIAAVGRAQGWDNMTAVGHSNGGHAITLAAALNPGMFARLILIDPVIMPPEWYGDAPMQGEHYAAKRRADWESPDEMFNRFKDRLPFSLWNPLVLRDYCAHGLVAKPDGGYTLACPPAIEASIYQQSIMGNIYAEIAKVDIPVLVIRLGDRMAKGTDDMIGSPTAPDLASKFMRGVDMHLPEYTHFGPMQDPERFARIIIDFEARTK